MDQEMNLAPSHPFNRPEFRMSSLLLTRQSNAIENLAIRPDDKQSLVALASSAHGGNTWDGNVCLFGMNSKQASSPQAAELALRDNITSVAWAGNHGSHLCVACDSGDVAVYAVPADPFKLGLIPAKAVASLEYHDDIVSGVAAVPGQANNRVVTTGWDGA